MSFENFKGCSQLNLHVCESEKVAVPLVYPCRKPESNLVLFWYDVTVATTTLTCCKDSCVYIHAPYNEWVVFTNTCAIVKLRVIGILNNTFRSFRTSAIAHNFNSCCLLFCLLPMSAKTSWSLWIQLVWAKNAPQAVAQNGKWLRWTYFLCFHSACQLCTQSCVWVSLSLSLWLFSYPKLEKLLICIDITKHISLYFLSLSFINACRIEINMVKYFMTF